MFSIFFVLKNDKSNLLKNSATLFIEHYCSFWHGVTEVESPHTVNDLANYSKTGTSQVVAIRKAQPLKKFLKYAQDVMKNVS